jgi:membrane-associated protein
MAPLRFYAVNFAAILLWAPAHVLPGVLAVSALHEYGVIPHHGGGKHYWMLAVIGGALVVALAVWVIRRRHGGGVIETAPAAARKDLK